MMKTLWTPEVVEDELTVQSPDAVADTCRVETPTVARDALYEQYKRRIMHNAALDRTLVSFQANKGVPFYGWF